MPVPASLASVLDLDHDQNWSVRPAERLVIIALLELLRPARTLALGPGMRGCTEWLGRYSGQVVSVDVDPEMLELSWRSGNVRRMHAGSQEAMIGFASREEHFDLAFVSGADAESAARDDLLGAAALADIVVLQDAFQPRSRAGYLDALRQLDVYADLDFQDGYLAADGMRGGLGLVIPILPRDTAPAQQTRLLSSTILAHADRLRSSRSYRMRQSLALLASVAVKNARLFESATP